MLDLIDPLIAHLRQYENTTSTSSVIFGIRPLDSSKAEAVAVYLEKLGYSGDATRVRQGFGDLYSLFNDLLQRPIAPEDSKLLSNRFYGFQAAAAHLIRVLGEMKKVIEAGRAEKPVDPDEEPSYLFRDEGGVYRVRFKGETNTIPKLKGAMYIYELLQHPNKEYPASKLHALVMTIDSEVESRRQWGSNSLKVQHVEDDGEMSCPQWDTGKTDQKEDQSALRNCHDRLEEIKADLEQPEVKLNSVEFDVLKQEESKILAEINKMTGLGGKARFKSTDERARTSVSKAIDRIIKSCREKWNLPKLAKYLNKHIKRGTSCFYQPPVPPPDWKF